MIPAPQKIHDRCEVELSAQTALCRAFALWWCGEARLAAVLGRCALELHLRSLCATVGVNPGHSFSVSAFAGHLFRAGMINRKVCRRFDKLGDIGGKAAHGHSIRVRHVAYLLTATRSMVEVWSVTPQAAGPEPANGST